MSLPCLWSTVRIATAFRARHHPVLPDLLLSHVIPEHSPCRGSEALLLNLYAIAGAGYPQSCSHIPEPWTGEKAQHGKAPMLEAAPGQICFIPCALGVYELHADEREYFSVSQTEGPTSSGIVRCNVKLPGHCPCHTSSNDMHTMDMRTTRSKYERLFWGTNDVARPETCVGGMLKGKFLLEPGLLYSYEPWPLLTRREVHDLAAAQKTPCTGQKDALKGCL